MTKPLEGVRVLEVAQAAFVPSAGLVLADWGANVIKVEHPETGDMVRGISVLGVDPQPTGIRYLWEIFNRGKRSIGIDLQNSEGREVLLRLVDQADVFLTNYLGSTRAQLKIDVNDIMERNSNIVYGRGTSHGPEGPDAELGGYDPMSYWSRNGMAIASMPDDYHYPISIPGPAFGDAQCGMALAGGIAAALYHRAQTQQGCVVDVSLLSSGLWAAQGTNVGACLIDQDTLPKYDRHRPHNPLANTYRTADNRYLTFGLLEADRYWPSFCRAIRHPELIEDERFASAEQRFANVEACVQLIDSIFAEQPLEIWVSALKKEGLLFSVVQTPKESQHDPQARINGFIQDVKTDSGVTLPITIAPAQFDKEAPVPSPAPGHAVDTDEVLVESGFDREEIMNLKIAGAIT